MNSATMNEKRIKKKLDTEMVKILSLEVAKPYCDSHALSFEKLKNQRFALIYGSIYFSQPSDVIPDGLRNDMETMPKPTLVIKNENDCIVIEETEYTRQYL